jgi:hypothetical protein
MKFLGLIDKYIFSLYLSDVDEDYESRLILGGVDEKFMNKTIDGGNILYTDIISEVAYMINIDGISLLN